MAELELGNCPFCGFDSPTMRVYKGKDGWRDRYIVVCRYDEGGCGAEGGMYHSAAEAAAAWNRRADIEKAPAVEHWIPCSERMPTMNEMRQSDCVLVCALDENWIGMAYYIGDGWAFADAQTKPRLETVEITHWMPLPSTEGLT